VIETLNHSCDIKYHEVVFTCQSTVHPSLAVVNCLNRITFGAQSLQHVKQSRKHIEISGSADVSFVGRETKEHDSEFYLVA